MKLIAWMQSEGVDDQQVADRLSALSDDPGKSVSVGAVRKWKYGERIPRPDEMVGLYQISNGKVTANDFYDLPSDPNEPAP